MSAGLFTPTASPPPVCLNTFCIECMGSAMGSNNNLRNATSGAWPAANRALYIPFIVTMPIIVTQLWCYNGATASGNVDMGLYDRAGTRLVSIGSTAQSGTNVLQAFDITDTTLWPGRFYIGVAMDNTTGTMFRIAGTARLWQAQGVAQQATAFVLPASMSPSAPASNYCPIVGWTRRTFL